MTVLATLATRALRIAAIRRAALTAAAVRGHGLVLVFHRISDEAPRERLIPTVPESVFRRYLEGLLDAGEIVALEALCRSQPNRHRPRFAVTFDDDWSTHHERALPILQNLGVTATFFLCGRTLHGLGPTWFEKLDALIAAHGIHTISRRLGIETSDPERLARQCERDLPLQERIEALDGEGLKCLSRDQIRALADAGMTIGFHTLHHRLLSLLPDAALDEALVKGRDELEEAAGRPMRLFAYPHGQADMRAPERLRSGGFIAACTGRPLPIRPADDPYLLGRWEPGATDLDRFIARLAARLNGWTIRSSI